MYERCSCYLIHNRWNIYRGDIDLWNTHSHCSCYPVHDMWQNFCFLPCPSPEIDNGGRIKTKLYDKHIGFTFPIVNSPFISSNILVSPAHGVCISQLICYSRACSQSSNLLDRAQLLTKKLLEQGFVAPRLKSSLQKLYGGHHNLLDIHISKDNGSSSFYIDVYFLCHCQEFYWIWLYTWVTRWVLYKKQELLTLREFTPGFICGLCCSSL